MTEPNLRDPACTPCESTAGPSSGQRGATPPAKPAPASGKQASRRPSWRSRLLHRVASVGVRTKIAGTLIIILSAAVLSLGVATFTRQNTILRHEVRSRAAGLAQELANVGKEGLLTKQELPVVATIADIHKRSDVVYAVVMDDEGRAFAHTDYARKGTLLTGDADRAAMKAEGLLFQETALSGDAILEAAVPVTLKTNSLKIGVARVGISQKALNDAIRQQQTQYLWIGVGFIAGGLVISLLLARVITKPLEALQEGIQVVSRGDLRRLVEVRSDDEIGKLTNVFNQMILSLREKLMMEKYLSQSTVLNIKEHRDVTQLKLGGERKYVTALFSDARGFTALAEQLPPEEVVGLMNIYLNLQTTVIHQWGGIVDKFVGDEVMAIFEGQGMEINALRAAVEIQSYCRTLNAARAAAGATQISIGIGLNSGDVVMGNMGSQDHMDYTVIGDSINVAARLCGLAQPGQVLVAKAVADVIGGQAVWREMSPVQVKGKNHPIGIAEAMSVQGGGRRALRKPTEAAVTYTLEGFSDESQGAVLRNISPGGCLLETSGPVGIGSKLNITMNLVDAGPATVRAIVYHAGKRHRAYYIGLCFENLPEDIRNRITNWIHRVNAELGAGLFV